MNMKAQFRPWSSIDCRPNGGADVWNLSMTYVQICTSRLGKSTMQLLAKCLCFPRCTLVLSKCINLLTSCKWIILSLAWSNKYKPVTRKNNQTARHSWLTLKSPQMAVFIFHFVPFVHDTVVFAIYEYPLLLVIDHAYDLWKHFINVLEWWTCNWQHAVMLL